MTSKRIGIVIPTLFERTGYLFEAVASIRMAGDAYILLSGPKGHPRLNDYIHLVDEFQPELDRGNLATKINHALNQLPKSCEYIGWLGDDDLLAENSLRRALAVLETTGIGLVYGACEYIDAAGNVIGRNPSGKWAKWLMRFGPFLIPQPASLWRRSVFKDIGGIDDKFKIAFDFDLFLRLIRKADAQYIMETQAAFRWHRESLSVANRWLSVLEASAVRRKQYSLAVSLLSIFWEPVIILITRAAGGLVSLGSRFRP